MITPVKRCRNKLCHLSERVGKITFQKCTFLDRGIEENGLWEKEGFGRTAPVQLSQHQAPMANLVHAWMSGVD